GVELQLQPVALVEPARIAGPRRIAVIADGGRDVEIALIPAHPELAREVVHPAPVLRAKDGVLESARVSPRLDLACERWRMREVVGEDRVAVLGPEAQPGQYLGFALMRVRGGNRRQWGVRRARSRDDDRGEGRERRGERRDWRLRGL